MSPDVKIDSVADELRRRVLNGDFGTSGRLPSLRMLGDELGVTHETVNKAFQRLQAEGLVISKGRSGVFVSKPRTRIPGITARFDLFLKEQGLMPVETNVESPGLVPAPSYVAKAMNISEGSSVVHRIRRQGTTSIYYRIAENFYPVDLAGGGILEDMRKDEKMDVILAIKDIHGKAIKFVHEDVIGRLPTTDEQVLLSIVRNTPVLEVFRTNYAEDHSTIVMFNRIVFVANLFLLDYDYIAPYWTGKN